MPPAHSSEIHAPVWKAVSLWVIAVLTDSTMFFWETFNNIPWDKFAQFAAFIYSLCLIYEYVRKKIRNGTKQDIP